MTRFNPILSTVEDLGNNQPDQQEEGKTNKQQKQQKQQQLSDTKGSSLKMVVWHQKSGRVETGIVAGLTLVNAAVNSYKVYNYWNENLDKFVDRVDLEYNKERVTHVCHILMAMSQLMNMLVFVSCIPVLYTVAPTDFGTCRKRRHGLVPFIVVHIFTLITSLNRMMLSVILTETGSKSAGYEIYVLDMTIDVIALFLIFSFYKALRSYKEETAMSDVEAISTPTTPTKNRMVSPAKGYVQFKDACIDVERFEFVKS